MKRLMLLFAITILTFSCKNDPKNKDQTSVEGQNKIEKKQLKPSDERAVEIMDSVIAKAGGKRYEMATMSFSFRDTTFISNRNCGQFELKRQFVRKDGDTVTDVVSNTGFSRDVEGGEENLSKKEASALRNKINSVHYFMQLPFGLNDPAVHKYYLGPSEIDGKNYQQVKVQFLKKGGGDDHQDEYRYWVNDSTLNVDYLAYSYETGESGLRFREAFNARKIKVIRFVDYKNFAPKSDSLNISDLEKAYQKGQLKMISKIENKNIQVELTKGSCD